MRVWVRVCFFFQAEDGIRYLVRSRGLGDVYKRQVLYFPSARFGRNVVAFAGGEEQVHLDAVLLGVQVLSLIHI